MARTAEPIGESDPSKVQNEPRNDDRRCVFIHRAGEAPREITYREFLTICRDDPHSVWETLKYHEKKIQEINQAEHQTRNEHEYDPDLRQQLQESETKIRDLTAQIQILVQERDKYRTATAEYALRFHKGGSLAAWNKRDPPLLTDGKNPKFEDWVVQMKSKLKTNADHYYDNESLRIAYVQSRLGGKAMAYAGPRFREESAHPYKSADEIFTYLQVIFHDPSRRWNAKRQFTRLQMKTDQKYHDFLVGFMSLAGEADINPDDYKDEMFHKVTNSLRNLTVHQYYEANTFNDYTTACHRAAYALQMNDE
ncbi:hypothetical protein DTO021D3_9021 [Paecilomyces variotii]|nr:hypothetical protein DTO032I3_4192 [Paecilomyces variotii]KAJ9274126.1 hypothetical protein DTO021D3_9021 [Paecilomyces variotii]KAJ9347038.1 hypothetical protein DTO027B6_605 [Paecilomyces variotii]KAJ9354780.1 hypothetical protein DTO027B9_4496 [Paecilomyces variotii]KAJ9393383.1 hypothetical protein DTO032I4_154 [Paecilomyces variotii]